MWLLSSGRLRYGIVFSADEARATGRQHHPFSRRQFHAKEEQLPVRTMCRIPVCQAKSTPSIAVLLTMSHTQTHRAGSCHLQFGWKLPLSEWRRSTFQQVVERLVSWSTVSCASIAWHSTWRSAEVNWQSSSEMTRQVDFPRWALIKWLMAQSSTRFEMGRNSTINDENPIWRYLGRIVQIKNTRVWEKNSRPYWNCTIWRFTRRKQDLIITDWRQW